MTGIVVIFRFIGAGFAWMVTNLIRLSRRQSYRQFIDIWRDDDDNSDDINASLSGIKHVILGILIMLMLIYLVYKFGW